RVLLARAICQEPDLILLDEPTSFLDIRHKLDLLSILRNMAKKKGITVVTSLHEIDLAMKFSDKILCVKGDHIAYYGEPDQIFEDSLIRDLYGIDNGYFDTTFGSIELPAPQGEPKTLVISSGGSGIPLYRKLQKEQKPFAAGILYENDIDYQLARLLAAEVITEEPFEELSDASIQKALEWVNKVEQVLAAEFAIGSSNRRIREVLDKAEKLQKLRYIGKTDFTDCLDNYEL
ncbi:MAG: ABC transporter ATP-binding protein, partial [Blautia sp.]|nr:ABC transporter ATP-binding protein [Blautia sp.]